MRERRHRRRIAGGDRGFELGQIRDEPRHGGKRLGAGEKVLLQQLRRSFEAPLELRLGFRRYPGGNELGPEPNREDGNESAREEHAIFER